MLNQENHEENQPSDNEEAAPQEAEKPVEDEKQESAEPEAEPQPAAGPLEEPVEPQPRATTGDLLVFPLCFKKNLHFSSIPASSKPHVLLIYELQNLDEEVNPMIADLEESNALALAIVAPGSVVIISMHCSIAYPVKHNCTSSNFELVLFCEENAFT